MKINKSEEGENDSGRKAGNFWEGRLVFSPSLYGQKSVGFVAQLLERFPLSFACILLFTETLNVANSLKYALVHNDLR